MSTISAGNTASTAIVITGDTSGNLAFTTGAGTNTITVPNLTGTIITNKTAGTVLQVVSNTLNTTLSVTANGTEQLVTGINATITPNFSTSKILIIAQIMYSSLLTTYGGYFKRNSTSIGLGATASGQQLVSMGMAFVTDGNQTNTFVYNYLDSPATTSSTTYQFYVNNDNTIAIYFNRSATDQANATGKRGISTVTLMEIAA